MNEDGPDGGNIPERAATGPEHGMPRLIGLPADPEAIDLGGVFGGVLPFEKNAVAVVATNAKRATIANIYALGFQLQLAMPRYPRVLLVAHEFVEEYRGNHRVTCLWRIVPVDQLRAAAGRLYRLSRGFQLPTAVRQWWRCVTLQSRVIESR